jgi:SAM-dependent methyltransferase
MASTDACAKKSEGLKRMRIGERVLLLVSRPPGSEDYRSAESCCTIDNALWLLFREYPGFQKVVSGKRVADFGCGGGHQSVSLAAKYNCFVVGIDTNRKSLQKATNLAMSNSVPDTKLSFVERITDDMKGTFDAVISQNRFEYFNDPEAVLEEMRELMTKSGKLLITFGPPWLAPYGSHMHLFCKVPWMNILFSEKTVMRVRSYFRHDGATRYEDVESGLNKMTVGRFERIVSSSGLKIEYRKYGCVKGMNFLVKIPIVREFFANRVSVILVNAI